jgi:hypothetical protein
MVSDRSSAERGGIGYCCRFRRTVERNAEWSPNLNHLKVVLQANNIIHTVNNVVLLDAFGVRGQFPEYTWFLPIS